MLSAARRLQFLVALLAAIAAGVAGASVVTGATTPAPAAGPAALAPDGSGAVLAATAPDPAADGTGVPAAARGSGSAEPPRWAVRVYRSQTGLTCPDVNRTVGGDYGAVGPDGTFTPLPLDASGACVALSADQPYELAVRHVATDGATGARAVVFGVATGRVTSIARTTDGTTSAVPLSNGAFVVALSEAQAATTTVTFTLADGTRQTHAIHVDPTIATAAP